MTVSIPAVRDAGPGGKSYHKAQVSPLVQKVSVDIDTVGLAQVFRNKRPDRRQELSFQRMFVLNVFQLPWQLCESGIRHGVSTEIDEGKRSSDEPRRADDMKLTSEVIPVVELELVEEAESQPKCDKTRKYRLIIAVPLAIERLPAK